MNRLPKYLAVLLKRRRLILLNTVILTVLAVGVSFLLPRRFAATAQLLPPSDEGDMFGTTGILGSGVSGTLSRLRLSAVGQGTASEVLAGIVTSRTVLDRVAEQCSIARYYRIRPSRTEAIARQLSKMTRVAVGDEGILRIRVEASKPVLAAKIANAYVQHLDEFMRTSNMNRGHNMRVFLERRLEEVEGTLAAASDSLRVFQELNRVVALDEETKAAIDAYADLKSEAYLRQAALDALAGVASEDNPYAVSLRRDLVSLQSQLQQIERGKPQTGFGVGFALSFAHLPAASAEFARRYRDYKIQEETYGMLSQQYEYAKVLEVRDAPALTVLDYAVPPQRHSFPKRSFIALTVIIFGLLSGAAWAFLLEYFGYLRRERPEEYDSWLAVRSELGSLRRGALQLFANRKPRA